jgi:predicted Zn-dependent peptidase
MKFSKTVLKNGLRVITIPIKDNPTATVLVLVEAGSKYEEKRVNGISHFLEHMCFKGTSLRPRAIDISRELDTLGSHYNAFTAQEYTGYYAKSDAKHFSNIFDVVSDIYLNSTFPEAEIEKEKGVIIEEINMYEDMPNRNVQDLIMELLYGDQPAGWNITGEKKNILAMRRDDFVSYKMEHYLPESTVLVVAGGINEEEVIAHAEKFFGVVMPGKKTGKVKVTESQDSPQVLLNYKKTDQSHFVLAMRSCDMFDKREPALSVLGGILGGGMSSRLFQKLREEMGVGYYVRAYNDAYTDHGFFQISAGVDNKRIEEVLKALIDECNLLKKEKISEDELNKVKEYLIGSLQLSLELSDDIANFYGVQELLRRNIESADEKANDIRKVTAEDIQDLAQDLFQDHKLNLAIIGPFEDKNPFLKLLKF